MPHPALGQWLRLELASRLGVAANLRIELPAEFAWRTMRETVPTLPTEEPFAPARLRWGLFDALRDWQEDDELQRYLSDGDVRQRFELADRLARVYDRCLLYRPEWIREWQAGRTPHWQARLWRGITRDLDAPMHWVDAVDAFRHALDAAVSVAAKQDNRQLSLPFETARDPADARVCFFGVSALSPSYLDMLRGVATLASVHLFLVSPCREFWADIRTPRERPPGAPEGYYTEGNELLAAWGRLGRDMQEVLADDLGTGAPTEEYVATSAATRLAAVQQDILDLRQVSGDQDAGLDADDSLQIHICHSAMREAEVLHDRLLALFEAHDDLEPADVLVLTPNLDDYAPAIEAVFGAAGLIRFTIGRQRRRDSTAVRAFLDLLRLPGSRYGTQAMLAPLRSDVVLDCFGLREGDLADIRGWLDNAGIRWGIDAAHVSCLGAPPTRSHTWRDGLRRLLLGYAVDEQPAEFKDVVPRGLARKGFFVGAGDYERLGQLVRYCETAFSLAGWEDERHPAQQWVEKLRDAVLGPFFTAKRPELSRQADAVATLIDDFAEECRVAGSSADVPFPVLRAVLEERAAEAVRRVPQLADGVTVGDLTAGQVYPAKVICAVGMNDGTYPRRMTPASFDLVGADRRRAGDRDVRDEDRFTFLEALLAARRCFLVSYTGRDLREDLPIPPSTVVSELTDYLASRFPQGAETHRTQHPLQPFSPRYFNGESGLFSYSQVMADAAQAVIAGGDNAPNRFAGVLPGGSEVEDEIALDELVRFAEGPARRFTESRLGMRLRIYEDELADEEPFQLDPLQAWQLRNDLFGFRTAGTNDETARALLTARGRLPEGNAGRIEHRRSAREAAQLAEALRPYEAQRRASPVDVTVPVGQTTVVGALAGWHEDDMLWWRIGGIRSKDRIGVWLRLLVAARATNRTLTANLVGLARGAVQREKLHGPSPSEAGELLDQWLAAWWQGQREPLPFFPSTSWAWLQAWEQGKDAAREALKVWTGHEWGEGSDEYHQLMFPEGPFGEAFEQLAEDLLGPLAGARDA